MKIYNMLRAMQNEKIPYFIEDKKGNTRYVLADSYEQCRKKFTKNWKIKEVSWQEYYENQAEKF